MRHDLKLDPVSIYSIFEHKVDVAEEIIRLGGNALGQEPHAGARRRTAEAIEAARYKGNDVVSSDDDSDPG